MRWKIGAVGAMLLMTTAAIQVAGFSDDDNLATVTTDGQVTEAYTNERAAHMSRIEDVTGEHGVYYQHDTGIPGDAPGTCEDLDHRRVVHDDGVEKSGMLIMVDDESDAIRADTAMTLGRPVTLEILGRFDERVQTIGFDVLTIDCQHVVTDPNDPMYDPISPAPGEGEKLVEADWDARPCRVSKDYWKFHVSDGAPSEIFIEWTNGEWERTSFVDSNKGQGNYITYSNIEYDIRHAEIIVPDDWDGKFELIQRPCDTVDGGAEPVERQIPPPDTSDGYARWHVREPEYVIVMYIEDAPITSEDLGMEGEGTALEPDSREASMMRFNPAANPCHNDCAMESDWRAILADELR